MKNAKKNTAGRKPAKPKLPAETRAKIKAIRDKVKRHQDAIMQQVAAREEIRRQAAEWVSVIRNRVSELKGQVGAVLDAVRKEGSVLGLVLDPARLSRLDADLDGADTSAMSLVVAGEDLPVPDLVMWERYLMENRFPLAGEGVKIMREKPETEA